MPKLIKFYGRECPHCHDMDLLDERLEKELGVKLERLEVWHNQKNAAKMQQVDTNCGGVPFYLNETTGESLCGAVNYETLKRWAQGTLMKQPKHNHEDDEHSHQHQGG